MTDRDRDVSRAREERDAFDSVMLHHLARTLQNIGSNIAILTQAKAGRHDPTPPAPIPTFYPQHLLHRQKTGRQLVREDGAEDGLEDGPDAGHGDGRDNEEAAPMAISTTTEPSIRIKSEKDGSENESEDLVAPELTPLASPYPSTPTKPSGGKMKNKRGRRQALPAPYSPLSKRRLNIGNGAKFLGSPPRRFHKRSDSFKIEVDD